MNFYIVYSVYEFLRKSSMKKVWYWYRSNRENSMKLFAVSIKAIRQSIVQGSKTACVRCFKWDVWVHYHLLAYCFIANMWRKYNCERGTLLFVGIHSIVILQGRKITLSLKRCYPLFKQLIMIKRLVHLDHVAFNSSILSPRRAASYLLCSECIEKDVLKSSKNT